MIRRAILTWNRCFLWERIMCIAMQGNNALWVLDEKKRKRRGRVEKRVRRVDRVERTDKE